MGQLHWLLLVCKSLNAYIAEYDLDNMTYYYVLRLLSNKLKSRIMLLAKP